MDKLNRITVNESCTKLCFQGKRFKKDREQKTKNFSGKHHETIHFAASAFMRNSAFRGAAFTKERVKIQYIRLRLKRLF